MKPLIAIFALVMVCLGAWKIWEYWQRQDQERAEKPSTVNPFGVVPHQLPGLNPKLEAPLQQAQREGAAGLKRWLDTYKRSGLAKDPRLAWIELDYVLLISTENPIEAKNLFAQIKKRTPADSPVYPRIKALEKTYE